VEPKIVQDFGSTFLKIELTFCSTFSKSGFNPYFHQLLHGNQFVEFELFCLEYRIEERIVVLPLT
jgi:hypothetical protein